MALTFQFKADGSGYKRGLENMRQDTKRFAGGVKSMLSSSFAMAGGIAAISAATKSIVNHAKEIQNLSRLSNTSTDVFQRHAHAAKSVGVQHEKLADIYKDSSDKIGDFLQTGGGPMADYFEKIAPLIGQTADEFRGLSGPDALQLYFNGLEKANLGQSEMTFYMEAIASDATLLIPLLEKAGQGFKDLGDDANVLGEGAIKKLVEMDRKLEGYQNKISTFWGGVAAAAATAVELISAQVTNMGLEAANTFRGVGNIVGDALTGDFKGAARHAKELKKDIEGIPDRLRETHQDVVFGDEGKSERGGEYKPKLDPNKLTPQQEKRLEIEKQIADEIERQAEATRTLQEKTAKAKGEWEKLQEKVYESDPATVAKERKKNPRKGDEHLTAGIWASIAEKNEMAHKEAILESEKAYTKFSALKRQLNEQERTEKEAAQKKLEDDLQKSKDYQEKVNAEADEDARKRREKQEGKEKDKLRIKTLRENSISTSSLAASGLGGNVSAFTADPALSEAKKQSQLLQDIKTSLQPAGGVQSTPEL